MQLDPDLHQPLNGRNHFPFFPAGLDHPPHVDALDEETDQFLLFGRRQFGQDLSEALQVFLDFLLFEDKRIRGDQFLPRALLIDH